MDVQKLIYFCVTKLVDNESAVNIIRKEAGDKSIYEIRVAPQDFARIIGREGRTFKSLRSFITLVDPEHVQDIVVDTSNT